MTTSPTTSVSPAGALVQLPSLPLDRYRAIVASLQAVEPTNRERIGRGLNVLLTCEIRETDRLGRYTVQSCADARVWYTATALHCTCPDVTRHPEQVCKHSAACTILSAASAEASYERACARYTLTARGEAALAARA